MDELSVWLSNVCSIQGCMMRRQMQLKTRQQTSVWCGYTTHASRMQSFIIRRQTKSQILKTRQRTSVWCGDTMYAKLHYQKADENLVIKN